MYIVTRVLSPSKYLFTKKKHEDSTTIVLRKAIEVWFKQNFI